MDLETRVRRLEQQNRWLKRFGGAAMAVVVGFLIMGQATPKKAPAKPRVVEAEAFVLKDKGGKIRGSWNVFPDGTTSLALNDKDEKLRGSWNVFPDGSTVLVLTDKDEKLRGNWGVFADGSTSLTLSDKDEKIRGSWSVHENGSTSMTIWDKSNRPRATLGSTSFVTTDAGTQTKTPEWSLVLFDKNGKVLFQAP